MMWLLSLLIKFYMVVRRGWEEYLKTSSFDGHLNTPPSPGHFDQLLLRKFLTLCSSKINHEVGMEYISGTIFESLA